MVTMLGDKENKNNKNNKCDSASGSFKSSLWASSPSFERWAKWTAKAKRATRVLEESYYSHIKILTRQFEMIQIFFDKCVRFFLQVDSSLALAVAQRETIHLEWNEKNKIKTWFDWHTEYTVLLTKKKRVRFIRQRLPQLWKWKAKFRLNRIDQSNRTNSRE